MTVDDSNITGPPKDGVLIKGLYLQGAGWEKKLATLVEASPMQLVCPIPTIHFKPVENKRKAAKGETESAFFRCSLRPTSYSVLQNLKSAFFVSS